MQPDSDLALFALVVRQGSLAGAAREMDLTPPAVSKRLAKLERRLGVRLLNRTTRRLTLTGEGEVYLAHARRILADIADMEARVSSSRDEPRGLLRINAPLGFGRAHVAPAVSAFAARYPEVEARLHLTDRPVALPDDAIDLVIRFGDLPDSRLIAQRVAANRRVLCATPAYLDRHSRPRTPADLVRHACIVLRQNDDPYGVWRLARGRDSEAIKVHGRLSTNDGEVALGWAREGHGILMRAAWNIADDLRSGALEEVLPGWTLPPADIHAVYPERLNLSAKVSAFVGHLRGFLAGRV